MAEHQPPESGAFRSEPHILGQIPALHQSQPQLAGGRGGLHDGDHLAGLLQHIGDDVSAEAGTFG